MYNKNSLMRNVLITPEEVIFHAPTKHTLDSRMIEQSIIIAEERFVKPELGFDLYEDLIAAKNLEITNGNKDEYQAKLKDAASLKSGDIINSFELMSVPYQKLWKQYLWKLTAECVLTSSYPEGFVQFGSEGSFHNSPPAGLMVTSGFVTPLLSSMKWSIDKKIQDRLAPLMGAMQEYICRNIGDFSKYKKECPDCENKDKTRTTDIALNLYDDDDSENCCEPGWMLK